MTPVPDPPVEPTGAAPSEVDPGMADPSLLTPISDPGAVDIWSITSSAGTAVAAGVAIVAAGVAVWQAYLARGARDASIKQAAIAGEALALQRTEQRATDVERYERAAPTFEVSIDSQTQIRPAGARIRMVGGPRRIEVTMNWQIRFTWLDPGEAPSHERIAEIEASGVYSASLCKGATIVVHTDERHDATLVRALAEFKVKSVEVGGETRTWDEELMTGWALDSV